MKRIATVVGARPQFIKVAPVSEALRATGEANETLIHTGQHFDDNMSDVFFRELGIRGPDFNLGVSGGGHGAMTGSMLQKLEPLMEQLRPDIVLVYGDTNSTLAGAIAAVKLSIPVAHVEAGLRSYDWQMPEEVNRVVTDRISAILFAPSLRAVKNLASEGIAGEHVHNVGDVMLDAALALADRGDAAGLFGRLGLVGQPFVLATIHRAENTSADRLPLVVAALEQVAHKITVVMPLHPRTRVAMERMNLKLDKVRICAPLGYVDMAILERSATVIATDSGGVQKEAFFHRVPCVTLRDRTEWTELVDAGWNRLAWPEGPDMVSAIVDAIGTRGDEIAPYGDGHAAQRIARALVR